MKHPTKAELVAAFRDLTEEQAALAVALCEAADDADKLDKLSESDLLPRTDDYVRRCYSLDSWERRREVILRALDELLGTYGVEPLYGADQEQHGQDAPAYEYCNAGETYATTLVFDRENDAIEIACWGDLVE